jgi:HlyD family secretion protein
MKNRIPPQFLAVVLLLSCGEKNDIQQASGVFEATEIVVSAEVNGKIRDFFADEGQQLKKGDLLCTIDSTSLHLSKMQLEANKTAVLAGSPDMEVQIAAMLSEIAKLEREKERTLNLLEGDAATQKQLDDINAQLEVLHARLKSQKSSLSTQIRAIEAQAKAIEAQIVQVEDQISKCMLASPEDATVLVRYAEPGEVAAMGKALCKMANLDNMVLRAYVTGELLSALKLGQRVTVYAEMGQSERRTYEGTIAWISGEAEFTPKTIQTQDERANLVYAVKVAVDNDGFLKIGMYGGFQTDNL